MNDMVDTNLTGEIVEQLPYELNTPDTFFLLIGDAAPAKVHAVQVSSPIPLSRSLIQRRSTRSSRAACASRSNNVGSLMRTSV